MGFPGRLNSYSTWPLRVEIIDTDWPTRHWHLEQTMGAVHRDAASSSSFPTFHGRTGPLKGKTPAVSAGAWQLHPWGGTGSMADYTARVNLNLKVIDFVQFGGQVYSTGKAKAVLTPQMLRDVYGVNAQVYFVDADVPQIMPTESVRRR